MVAERSEVTAARALDESADPRPSRRDLDVGSARESRTAMSGVRSRSEVPTSPEEHSPYLANPAGSANLKLGQ
jgi:hypothetical protein